MKLLAGRLVNIQKGGINLCKRGERVIEGEIEGDLMKRILQSVVFSRNCESTVWFFMLMCKARARA
jgi:hypothetical protein